MVSRLRKSVLCLCIVLVCGGLSLAGGPLLAIRHVTVVDVKNGRELHDMTVLVKGGRIEQVGSRVRVPKKARLVEGRGKYLIPGLWDMHVHITMGDESALALFVANGVTSVRDMGGNFATISAWRQRIGAGELVGPRIKTPGPALESAQFVAILGRISALLDPQYRPLLEETRNNSLGIASPADAEKAVSQLAAEGVDFIKVRTAASPETYRAIARASKQAKLVLVGHVPDGVSLAEASDEGQRSLEHVFFDPLLPKYSDAEISALSEEFLKNGTWLVPTLIIAHTSRLEPDAEVGAIIDDDAGVRDGRRKYVCGRLVQEWRMQRALDKFESPDDWAGAYKRSVHMLNIMHAKHVPMLAGTDFGGRLIFPGFSLHDELGLMVTEAGFTPAEALASATLAPARFFGMEDSLGTVEPGKLADLVLLDDDPLTDIQNTRKIAAVIAGGRLFEREDLRQLLAASQRKCTPTNVN